MKIELTREEVFELSNLLDTMGSCGCCAKKSDVDLLGVITKQVSEQKSGFTKDHVHQMHVEVDELDERLKGFEWFVNSDLFKERIKTEEQVNLAKEQLSVMKRYKEILEKRINYFEEYGKRNS